MRFAAVLAALAGVALAVPCVAGQNPTPPPTFQKTTLVLAPATMQAWRDGLRKQAAAAKAANLPANEVGWWAANDLNRTIMVRPVSRDALFHPTQLMQKIEKANPAAAKEIRDVRQGTQVVGVTTEIFQAVPDLEYQPAQPLADSATTGMVMVEYWIAPGQRQAFGEAIKAMNKIYADAKYPYPRYMGWYRMGDNRLEVTTFIDSRENYYGKNSLARLTAGNTAAREAMAAARQALLKTISNMETTYVSLPPGLSYPPEM